MTFLLLILATVPAFAQTQPLTLPPGRTCTANDLRGRMKLVAIAEQPRGAASGSFAVNPHQYIEFADNSVFRRFEAYQDVANPQELGQRLASAQGQAIEQFVLTATGGLYLYRSGAAYDALSCMVVGQDQNPYHRGDKVLFTLNQATPSLIKIYRNVNFKGQGRRRLRR